MRWFFAVVLCFIPTCIPAWASPPTAAPLPDIATEYVARLSDELRANPALVATVERAVATTAGSGGLGEAGAKRLGQDIRDLLRVQLEQVLLSKSGLSALSAQLAQPLRSLFDALGEPSAELIGTFARLRALDPSLESALSLERRSQVQMWLERADPAASLAHNFSEVSPEVVRTLFLQWGAIEKIPDDIRRLLKGRAVELTTAIEAAQAKFYVLSSKFLEQYREFSSVDLARLSGLQDALGELPAHLLAIERTDALLRMDRVFTTSAMNAVARARETIEEQTRDITALEREVASGLKSKAIELDRLLGKRGEFLASMRTGLEGAWLSAFSPLVDPATTLLGSAAQRFSSWTTAIGDLIKDPLGNLFGHIPADVGSFLAPVRDLFQNLTGLASGVLSKGLSALSLPSVGIPFIAAGIGLVGLLFGGVESALRELTAAVQGLRETLLQVARQLNARLDAIEFKLNAIQQTLSRMEGKLDRLAFNLQVIEQRVGEVRRATGRIEDLLHGQAFDQWKYVFDAYCREVEDVRFKLTWDGCDGGCLSPRDRSTLGFRLFDYALRGTRAPLLTGEFSESAPHPTENDTLIAVTSRTPAHAIRLMAKQVGLDSSDFFDEAEFERAVAVGLGADACTCLFSSDQLDALAAAGRASAKSKERIAERAIVGALDAYTRAHQRVILALNAIADSPAARGTAESPLVGSISSGTHELSGLLFRQGVPTGSSTDARYDRSKWAQMGLIQAYWQTFSQRRRGWKLLERAKELGFIDDFNSGPAPGFRVPEIPDGATTVVHPEVSWLLPRTIPSFEGAYVLGSPSTTGKALPGFEFQQPRYWVSVDESVQTPLTEGDLSTDTPQEQMLIRWHNAYHFIEETVGSPPEQWKLKLDAEGKKTKYVNPANITREFHGRSRRLLCRPRYHFAFYSPVPSPNAPEQALVEVEYAPQGSPLLLATLPYWVEEDVTPIVITEIEGTLGIDPLRGLYQQLPQWLRENPTFVAEAVARWNATHSGAAIAAAVRAQGALGEALATILGRLRSASPETGLPTETVFTEAVRSGLDEIRLRIKNGRLQSLEPKMAGTNEVTKGLWSEAVELARDSLQRSQREWEEDGDLVIRRTGQDDYAIYERAFHMVEANALRAVMAEMGRADSEIRLELSALTGACDLVEGIAHEFAGQAAVGLPALSGGTYGKRLRNGADIANYLSLALSESRGFDESRDALESYCTQSVSAMSVALNEAVSKARQNHLMFGSLPLCRAMGWLETRRAEVRRR